MDSQKSKREDGLTSLSLVAPLLDVKDVAAILGIAPKTVHKLVRQGKLAYVQATERDRRFTTEQVKGYIDAHTVEVRIDKKNHERIRSRPPMKGGEKSFGVFGTGLTKEIRELCR